jgi:hypothetical protein
MNANNVFSIVSRLQSTLAHPLIKRANLGFTLTSPFSWSLINAAAVLARMPQLESDPLFNSDRLDQLKTKCANLRHFNRQVGDNEVGMGAINQCLRLDEEVNLEGIQKLARDRVKVERRSGKCSAANVKSRYVQLYTAMYEAAQQKHREQRALIDEVYFICNRSDELLFDGSTYQDEELVDFDEYDYVVEGLLDRCVQPIVKATEELQRVLDKSYRVTAIAEGQQLMAEIKRIGTEVGISWAKMDAENKAIDEELRIAAADEAAVDADLDACMDEVDLGAMATVPVNRVTVTIKSPERLAREAEDARVAAVDADLKDKAAKAKAKRALAKAAKESV